MAFQHQADAFDVIIVGGGVAGAASAYHLATRGVRVLILEAGDVGRGDESVEVQLVDEAACVYPASLGSETRYRPYGSGTAVMRSASTIKQITALYPSSSREFVRHHGKEGAATYLRLSATGIELQKQLARRFLPSPSTQLRELGGLYVATSSEEEELRDEYKLLREFGADVEWWDREKVEQAHGKDAGFACGIFLRNDAVIDSTAYAKALIAAACDTGNAVLRARCPRVVDVQSGRVGADRVAWTFLADGSRLQSRWVVVAAGGHFVDRHLGGLLSPCWSYLVSLPDPRLRQQQGTRDGGNATAGMALPSSPNFYTWGFTHDWCTVEGYVRVSGEDHFSALKPPRATERCRNLALWAAQKYPYLRPGVRVGDDADADAAWAASVEQYYAVYSETPDAIPLVGRPYDSAICYLVGCNAWGQASLSLCASLVPALLEYETMPADLEDMSRLVSIRRFAGHPALGLTRAVSSSTQHARAHM